MGDSLTAFQPIRTAVSLTISLALVFCPFGAEYLTTMDMLGISVGLTWILVGVQVVGILPRNGTMRKGDRTELERLEVRPASGEVSAAV